MIFEIYLYVTILCIFVMYLMLEIISIINYRLFNKDKNWLDIIKWFYKSIKFMKIDKFDDCFVVNSVMSGGYILSSLNYYIKIININEVILITKSTYQCGYTLLKYTKTDDEFIESKINIVESPALLYWYRFYKLTKLINKNECRIVKREEIDKVINQHYTMYNRDIKIKQLLNE